MPNKFDVAKEDVRLQGVMIDISPEGGAVGVERLNVALKGTGADFES
jgi:calcineurin-like phosphoesterase